MNISSIKELLIQKLDVEKHQQQALATLKDSYLANEELMEEFLDDLPRDMTLENLEIKYHGLIVFFKETSTTFRLQYLLGLPNNGQDYYAFDYDVDEDGIFIDEYFDCYL